MTAEDWIVSFGFFVGTLLFALMILLAVRAIRMDRGSHGS